MEAWYDERDRRALDERTTVERRIGHRLPVEGIDVRWVVQDQRRGRGLGRYGRVVDVSVSGAAVHSPSGMSLTEQSLARLRYGSGESRVRVRRITTTSQPDVVCLGVEFVDLDDELRERIYDLLATR